MGYKEAMLANLKKIREILDERDSVEALDKVFRANNADMQGRDIDKLKIKVHRIANKCKKQVSKLRANLQLWENKAQEKGMYTPGTAGSLPEQIRDLCDEAEAGLGYLPSANTEKGVEATLNRLEERITKLGIA